MKMTHPIDWRKLDLDDEQQMDDFDRHLQDVARAAAEDAAAETKAFRQARRAPLPAK